MLFSRKRLPEIISLHIPKTAGTSFRNILKNVYGEKEVVRFDINNKDVVRVNEELYTRKTLPEVKVIHGHFAWQSLTSNFELPESFRLITWVREPAERVISNYFYLESRLKEILDEEQRNLNILSKLQRTLIEYARAGINRNRQSKFLKGRELSAFDFIGIQEDFGKEINRLASVLNWKNIPEVLYQNKTPGREASIEKDVIEEIRQLNSEDYEIYREALRLRGDPA